VSLGIILRDSLGDILRFCLRATVAQARCVPRISRVTRVPMCKSYISVNRRHVIYRTRKSAK
jgi:hypothetical protein